MSPRGKNAPYKWEMNDFSLGWDNNSPATMLDPRCVADAKNFNLTNKKGLSKRGGMTKLYASLTSVGAVDINNLFEYKSPQGTNYLLVAFSTFIKAWYNPSGGVQWNIMKSSLTSGLKHSFAVHLGSCYIANGTDANFRLFNPSGGAINDITAYNVGIPVRATKPAVALGTGTLNGDYRYKTCYMRTLAGSIGYQQVGNPSAASDLIQPGGSNGVDVTLVASTDTNVTHIRVYRTLNGGSIYYKQGDHANSDGDITDNTSDNLITVQLETNNHAPPKAKFLTVHKDRMFYANCPAETDGEYLVVWSKSGKPESIPITDNFQYFDRADGEAITGIASLGDYLVVFKRNKISILAGDLTESSELYSIAMGVGCIASWAILPFEDKVVFLSEEGWKACDGKNVFNLSQNINGILADGWITENENANVSAIYYPEKSQMQFNINHSTLGDRVYCGQFLIPLILMGKGAAEQDVGALVAWTYHDYANHEITCIGTYTDTDGITRPIAGDSAGWLYELDSGTADIGADDVSNNIACTFQTDWVDLTTGRGLTKTTRKGYLDYTVSGTTLLTFNIERNFSDTDDTQTITGTGGVGNAIGANFNLSGTGRRFRFTVTQNDAVSLDINGISVFFRVEGRR